MSLQLGDILVEEITEWRVSHPYSSAGGKTVNCRHTKA